MGRPPAERMNSPLEKRKVRLRGLGGLTVCGARHTFASATRASTDRGAEAVRPCSSAQPFLPSGDYRIDFNWTTTGRPTTSCFTSTCGPSARSHINSEDEPPDASTRYA